MFLLKERANRTQVPQRWPAPLNITQPISSPIAKNNATSKWHFQGHFLKESPILSSWFIPGFRMSLTDHQAKDLAYELTRRWSSDSVGKLAAAVAGAQVDLNPHQVDAALFAFNSPFSNGALLADEVGLGKTIEAGILLSQRWAERKRRILIITPSNLRKQWHQELAEKFFLPATILEARSYKQATKAGSSNPFQPDEPNLVICSYHFARN